MGVQMGADPQSFNQICPLCLPLNFRKPNNQHGWIHKANLKASQQVAQKWMGDIMVGLYLGCPHATPRWQLQRIEAHTSHNNNQDILKATYRSFWKHTNFCCLDNDTKRHPDRFLSISANRGPIQNKFKCFLSFLYPSQVGCPVVNRQHYSYTVTIKTSTRGWKKYVHYSYLSSRETDSQS